MPARRFTRRQESWRDDPAVLERVSRACELRRAGGTARQIALTLGVSERTARADLARGRSLWRERSASATAELMRASLGRYERVAAEAWRRLAALPLGDAPAGAAALLRTVADAQHRQDELLGLVAQGGRIRLGGLDDAELRADILALAQQYGILPAATDGAPTPANGESDRYRQTAQAILARLSGDTPALPESA